MKNYEEMARSVLERSNNIINKRNKRRKTLAGVVVAAVACFVVVVIAHTISNGGKGLKINKSYDIIRETYT